MTDLTLPGTSPFDAIRRIRPDGSEFWTGRELQPLMGYARWENFETPLNRAMAAARNQGFDVSEHFLRSQENSGGRPRANFELTRFAAYLVAMNGDPNMGEVAAAQAYFAIKTREAEVRQQAKELTRLELIEMARESELGRLAESAARQVAEAKVAELEGPAESWQHFASTDGDLSVNEAAKVLSRHPGIAIGERRLWAWLDEHRWTYRDGAGDRRAYQTRIDSGHLTARARGHHHPSTGEWVIDAPQVRMSMKGLELVRRHLVGLIKVVAS